MARNGSIWRNDVHHHPWPLQLAEAEFERNTLLHSHGLSVPTSPALLYFSKRVDVVVWDAGRAALVGVIWLSPLSPSE
jgi:hypothetical protein